MRQLKKTLSITARDSESIGSYLNEISQYEILSPLEEAETAEIIQKHDKRHDKYVAKLVRANLRFVVTVAKQYKRDNISLSDLIEEGNIGLIIAAKNFDPTRGFKFISYAVWWIRQCIMSFMTSNHMIRVPSNRQNLIATFYEENAKHLQEYNTPLDLKEFLAEKDPNLHIEEFLTLSGGTVSADTPLTPDSDSSIYDLKSSTSNAEERVEKSDRANVVINMVNSLPCKEKIVISGLFGIGGAQKSMSECADELGVSRERARQIAEQAKNRIRRGKYANYIRQYL